MKSFGTNKKAYRIVAALVMTLAVGICFVASNVTTYAGNIIITGDAAGSLSITSEDKMLFDLTGLYPGDTSESSVTIRNTDMVNDGFEVFMYAENSTEVEYDLGQVTRLLVTDGDTTIYDGMLIDFDEGSSSATPISLGQLAQGVSRALAFAIEIDGEQADNNYQEQESNFVVTFVASSYGEPVPVPTPTPGGGGGGGGGSSLTPASVATGTTTSQESSDIVRMDNNDTPLGYTEPSASEPAEKETEMEAEKAPLGAAKEMPKTGEATLALNIALGVIISCGGLIIIKGNGKKIF